MLEVSNIQAGYADTQILHGVSLSLEHGTCLALLGRNGMGKSTTLKAIMGLIHIQSGDIILRRSQIAGQAAYEIAHAGIAYVPETRDIFPSLTVLENLRIAEIGRSGAWSVSTVLDLFPKLADRLDNAGNQLSGGEQQMLAIARALMMNPDLLILDEPTEGLAPIIVQQIQKTLQSLKMSGLTILLVEQNFRFAQSLADHAVILNRGQNVWQGEMQELSSSENLQKQWLGL